VGRKEGNLSDLEQDRVIANVTLVVGDKRIVTAVIASAVLTRRQHDTIEYEDGLNARPLFCAS
jgi:hypothetical protein